MNCSQLIFSPFGFLTCANPRRQRWALNIIVFWKLIRYTNFDKFLTLVLVAITLSLILLHFFSLHELSSSLRFNDVLYFIYVLSVNMLHCAVCLAFRTGTKIKDNVSILVKQYVDHMLLRSAIRNKRKQRMLKMSRENFVAMYEHLTIAL